MNFKNKKTIIGLSMLTSLLCFSSTVSAKEITLLEYRTIDGFKSVASEKIHKLTVGATENYYYKLNNNDIVSSKYIGSVEEDKNAIRAFSTSLDKVTALGNAGKSELTCEHNSSQNDYGVANIIQRFNNSDKSGENYYYTELAIQKYLGKTISGTLTDNYTNIVDAAKEVAKLAKTEIKYNNEKRLSNVSLTYDENNKIWKSAPIKAENMNRDAKFTYVMTNEAGKKFDSYVYFVPVKDGELGEYQIGVCNNNSSESCKGISNFKELEPGKYTITIETRRNLPYAELYECHDKTNTSEAYYDVYSSKLVTEKDSVADATITAVLTIEETTSDKKNIDIKFVDKSGNNIKGVKYNIFDKFESGTCSGNNLTGEVTSLGNVMSVPTTVSATGKYCLNVNSVPEGYSKPADALVEIKNNVLTVTLESELKTGNIKISVVDKDKKLLEDVKFKICTDKDCNNEKYNVVSTDESYTAPNVPFGTYYVKFTAVPEGYVLPTNTLELVLNAENDTITKTVIIEATTKVPDTLSNISKLFILCGIVGIISGITLVYTSAKKQEQV